MSTDKQMEYEALDVITTIRQTIEVPKGVDKVDVLNFLAQGQNFNDAFKGLRNERYGMSIQDIEVIHEEIEK